MDGNGSSQPNQSQSAGLAMSSNHSTNRDTEYLKAQLELERKMNADLRREMFDIRSGVLNEREKQKELKDKEKVYNLL